MENFRLILAVMVVALCLDLLGLEFLDVSVVMVVLDMRLCL